MPTEIPIHGSLAARLGLTRNALANVESPGQRQGDGSRLNPESFFGLTAIDRLMKSHPGLLLDRFLPFDRSEGWNFDMERKNPFLGEFARRANQSYADNNAPWRQWSKRHRAIYPENDLDSRMLTLVPNWRWIIGLGNNTILETGLTLHHTYGIPYIPGPGLKGLTQAYVNLTPSRKNELCQSVGKERSTFERIFGTQYEMGKEEPEDKERFAGEIVFVGGVPVDDDQDPPRLVVDVMTPHFPKYYQDAQGRRAPLEVEDPVPVAFLACTGGAFDITIATRCPQGRELLDLTIELCREALDELGIGGKTGKGYGYFVEG
jgi:CRISPR-associated protein Cmr6